MKKRSLKSVFLNEATWPELIAAQNELDKMVEQFLNEKGLWPEDDEAQVHSRGLRKLIHKATGEILEAAQ